MVVDIVVDMVVGMVMEIEIYMVMVMDLSNACNSISDFLIFH